MSEILTKLIDIPSLVMLVMSLFIGLTVLFVFFATLFSYYKKPDDYKDMLVELGIFFLSVFIHIWMLGNISISSNYRDLLKEQEKLKINYVEKIKNNE